MSHLKQVLCAMLSIVAVITATPTAFTANYDGSDSYKNGHFHTAISQIKLTGNGREDIISVAESQRYYFGGSDEYDLSGVPDNHGKYTEYGYSFGVTNANWCGFFISWCARTAGISSSVLKSTGVANPINFGLAGQSKLEGGAAYTWSEFTNGMFMPTAGDLIFYGNSSGMGFDGVPIVGYTHVGIIKEVIINSDGSYSFVTIEGNTSVSGYSSQLRGVDLKTRTVSAKNAQSGYTGYWYIRAFGVPDYEQDGQPEIVYPVGKYTTTANSGLIIRSGPSTTYDRLSKIPYNTQVEITETDGNWGKLNYEGISGWICLDYATFIEPLNKKLTSLIIDSLPDKCEYKVGDIFDKSGLKIMAVYSDGTTADVTDDCAFSPLLLNLSGNTEISAVYGGKSVAFTVTVNESVREMSAKSGKVGQISTSDNNVLMGDVDGDGRITSTDYIKIKNAYLGKYSFTEIEFAAADVSGDGRISSNDFIIVRRYYLGLNTFA